MTRTETCDADFVYPHAGFGFSAGLERGRAEHGDFRRRGRSLVQNGAALRLHVLDDIEVSL